MHRTIGELNEATDSIMWWLYAIGILLVASLALNAMLFSTINIEIKDITQSARNLNNSLGGDFLKQQDKINMLADALGYEWQPTTQSTVQAGFVKKGTMVASSDWHVVY